MIKYLDIGSFNAGLGVGRRLISPGNSQRSLPLMRELFAGAAESRSVVMGSIVPGIENWIVPTLPSSSVGKRAVDSETLSDIVAELASLGFNGEAVRVLVTAVGLNPDDSAELLKDAQIAFDKPSVRAGTVNYNNADRLMNVGMNYLKSGAADGITLMNTARRVGGIPLPIDDIRTMFKSVPDTTANWARTSTTDAQALTDYAFDLYRLGKVKTAVGLGTMVTPMLGGKYAYDMMDDLAATAGTANAAVIDAGRSMMTKGYAEQATDFLIASGATSPTSVWDSLQKNVIGPSPDVSAPWRIGTYARAVSNAVAGTAPPPPEKTPPPPGDKALYFMLEGDGVRCDQVKWGTEFDLVFNYDSPPPQALVEVYGKKFEALKNSEATLVVTVFPVGLFRVGSVAAQEKTFKNGEMLGDPLRFKLRAPARDSDHHPKVGVYVTFSINCNAIYKTFLPIRLVDQLGQDPCKRSNLDLDVAEILEGASRPRAAEVFIYSNIGGWDVSWTIAGKRSEQKTAKKLSKAELDKAYEDGFLGDLKGVAKRPVWNNVTENLAFADEDSAAPVRDSLRRTMAAGSKFHRILSREPVFKELIEKIDQLPEGSRVAFHTENSVFPWELMYPLYYDYQPSDGELALEASKNEDPKRFWGFRFHIESLLIDVNDKSLAEGRQTGKLRVSAGLNTAIDKEERWIRTPPGPVERQRKFFEASFSGRWDDAEESAGVVDILKQANPASMIYFYCHGSSSELDFGDVKVESHAIRSDINYPHWPIVFINACDAGNISPLSFVSFRTEFSEKKAAGVIAPSFPIPTLFAAYFARAVLTEYDKRRPIGEIMFELRRALLDQNNPLGLWYSVQCPLDVTAPKD